MSAPAPGTGNDTKELLSLEHVLKIFAVASGLVYGVLFIAYRRYYNRLGLAPEDFGISNAYILVRSFGFAMLTMAITVTVWSLVWLLVLLYRWILPEFFATLESTPEPGEAAPGEPAAAGEQQPPSSWFERVVGAIAVIRIFERRLVSIWPRVALGGIAAVFVAILSALGWRRAFTDWSLLLLFLVLLYVAVVTATLHVVDRTIGVIASITGALLMGFVLPALLVIARAGGLAGEVAAGKPVDPYELLDVPVLDVSAHPVTVSWIGPANQRPPLFGVNAAHPVHALLLGRGGGAVFVEVIGGSEEIIAVPTAFVMTQSQVP